MLITKLNRVAILALAAFLTAWFPGVSVAQPVAGDRPRQETPPPLKDEKTLSQKEQQPHNGSRGHPLPEGALARLGDIQLRHGGGIRASALAPDGKTLATAGGGIYAVILWDLQSGNVVRRLQGLQGDTFVRPCLAFSPDGTHLAYLQGPHFGYIWDLRNGAEIHRFERRDKDV